MRSHSTNATPIKCRNQRLLTLEPSHGLQSQGKITHAGNLHKFPLTPQIFHFFQVLPLPLPHSTAMTEQLFDTVNLRPFRQPPLFFFIPFLNLSPFLFTLKLPPSPLPGCCAMSQRPKREAVINRGGTDQLLNLQKRRTPAEVQRDKDLVASTKAAAKAQKVATDAQNRKRVADFEDQLRKEDQDQEKNMSRPDLLAGHRVCHYFFSAAGDLLKKKHCPYLTG